MQKEISNAADFIRSAIRYRPEIAMILGTGLNPFADLLTEAVSIPYDKIPGFVPSTAPFHQGKLVCGLLDDQPLLLMQGRLHYYEGYDLQTVTFPVRVLKEIGTKILILTNASGSLKKELAPGDLVLITDHINLMGTNPLIGSSSLIPGDRFPSLNDAYSKELLEKVRSTATAQGITIGEGVYAGVTGPSLETRAECLMLKKMGADLVGMSTVPETIVGIQCGLKILAISVVTNYSNIFHSEAHSQEEIRENAGKALDNIKVLVKNLIRKLSED